MPIFTESFLITFHRAEKGRYGTHIALILRYSLPTEIVPKQMIFVLRCGEEVGGKGGGGATGERELWPPALQAGGPRGSAQGQAEVNNVKECNLW